MALTVQGIISQAKALPRPLKIVIAIAIVDLVILLIANLALQSEVQSSADQVTELRAHLKDVRKKVGDARSEIDRLPELRKQYDQAIAEGLLGNQDRLKLVQISQDSGNRHHVLDMHYKLDPEQTAKIPGSQYLLVTSPVSLDTGGLLDPDVFDFWDDILNGMTAHYLISYLSLQRTGPVNADVIASIQAGKPVSLIKTSLRFRWLSLRSPQTTAQQ